MLPLSQGILAAFLTVLTAAAARGAPTRRRCPTCGGATGTIEAPAWLERRMSGLVARRWCPSCGWQGLGRDGPDWVPGRPLAHDSGFHWGAERLPGDFGFRFAEERPAADLEPRGAPAHPSGFRFAAGEKPPGMRAHSSGFRWKNAG